MMFFEVFGLLVFGVLLWLKFSFNVIGVSMLWVFVIENVIFILVLVIVLFE